jgi:DNA sulfur modification protein DndD
LADVSGYHIPLVVDTPLARLDSMHRENLLAYWRSDPERQVILLSQDKEIDASLAGMLEGFLANTWLLESKPIGGGLYRTSAREGYFGGDQ